jgi:hypothetical protein
VATNFRRMRMASSFILAVALLAPSVGSAGVQQALLSGSAFPVREWSIADGPDMVFVKNQKQRPHSNEHGNSNDDSCRSNPQRCNGGYGHGNEDDYRNNGGRYYGNDSDHPRYRGGYRGYSSQRQGYRQGDDGWWYPLAAFALGAIILNQQNNSAPVYQVPSGNMTMHDNWCAQKYRSYDFASKTYQPYYGPRQYCNSPYDQQ